ncbi:hypothetical protein Tco_1027899 [Tanacetum coccineum]
MRQDYNSTRSGFEDIRTVLGDGVAVPSDTVRMNKRRHQKNGDGVKTVQLKSLQGDMITLTRLEEEMYYILAC